MAWEELPSAVGSDLMRSYLGSREVPGFGPEEPEQYTPAYARDLEWAVEREMATPER